MSIIRRTTLDLRNMEKASLHTIHFFKPNFLRLIHQLLLNHQQHLL